MITINLPMFDWMTATTKDYRQFERVSGDIINYCGGIKGEKQNRSIGVSWSGMSWDNGYFVGTRLNNGVMIYIVVISGEASNDSIARDIIMSPDWHKTRLDMQVTITGGFRPLGLADFMRKNHISKGVKPVIRSIDDGSLVEGTVYVGSRKSELYARVYMKLAEGGRVVTRYEVETKGRYIHDFIMSCTVHGLNKGIARHIAGHVNKFNLGNETKACEVLKRVREVVENVGNPSLPVMRIQADDKTMRWLTSQVSPAIYKLCQSHDPHVRKLMKALLVEWLCDYEELNQVDMG